LLERLAFAAFVPLLRAELLRERALVVPDPRVLPLERLFPETFVLVWAMVLPSWFGFLEFALPNIERDGHTDTAMPQSPDRVLGQTGARMTPRADQRDMPRVAIAAAVIGSCSSITRARTTRAVLIRHTDIGTLEPVSHHPAGPSENDSRFL
jgi:hypothetical protein